MKGQKYITNEHITFMDYIKKADPLENLLCH